MAQVAVCVGVLKSMSRCVALEGRNIARFAFIGLFGAWLSGCSSDATRLTAASNPFSNPFSTASNDHPTATPSVLDLRYDSLVAHYLEHPRLVVARRSTRLSDVATARIHSTTLWESTERGAHL